MDKEKQLSDSVNLDDELYIAIIESETEYSSENQLIDAREALSQLKRKHFDKNVEAMRDLQKEMQEEFKRVGITSEEDIQKLVHEAGAEIEGIDF